MSVKVDIYNLRDTISEEIADMMLSINDYMDNRDGDNIPDISYIQGKISMASQVMHKLNLILEETK